MFALVVARETDTSDRVREPLEANGWWVAAVEDRETALRSASDQEPHLVVVDGEIPSAGELVRNFASRHGGPGCLLVAPAGNRPATGEADGVLSRPPVADEILAAATRLLERPQPAAVAGPSAAGQVLSAEEIFGDMLLEMDAAVPAPETASAGELAPAVALVAAPVESSRELIEVSETTGPAETTETTEPAELATAAAPVESEPSVVRQKPPLVVPETMLRTTEPASDISWPGVVEPESFAVPVPVNGPPPVVTVALESVMAALAEPPPEVGAVGFETGVSPFEPESVVPAVSEPPPDDEEMDFEPGISSSEPEPVGPAFLVPPPDDEVAGFEPEISPFEPEPVLPEPVSSELNLPRPQLAAEEPSLPSPLELSEVGGREAPAAGRGPIPDGAAAAAAEPVVASRSAGSTSGGTLSRRSSLPGGVRFWLGMIAGLLVFVGTTLLLDLFFGSPSPPLIIEPPAAAATPAAGALESIDLEKLVDQEMERREAELRESLLEEERRLQDELVELEGDGEE